MPGYRRFIAYVYEYVQGKKGDGKGFIKVEARNGICRMSFKLRGIQGRDSVEARAYGYVREGNSARGIYLGKGDLAGSQAEFELESGEDQIGGSSYSLGDLGGLLILGENGEIYASGWDEQPVRPDMIMLPSLQEEKDEDNPLPEEEDYEDGNTVSDTLQIFPQEDSVTDTEPDSGEVPGGAEGKNSEMPGSENREMQGKSKSENRETSDEPESEYREESENAYYMTPGTEAGSAYQGEYGEAEEILEENPAPEEIPETASEYEETVRESQNTVRIADEAMMESQSAAPKQLFIPFSDEEITDCQKVTPADLRILGRRDRGLMNNNFLRYGVKNYGHLLIGKRKEDGRYILGVPGIYERQESLMANMFGFPYFKECAGSRERRGRFGYWYRLIDTPQF